MRTSLLLVSGFCLLVAIGFVLLGAADAQEAATPAVQESAGGPASEAKPVGIDRSRHPWAHFKPGAWREHRVTTEIVDERGEVSGVSTTNTTQSLEEVGKSKYSIREDSTLDVQNKLFQGPPQWVKSGFFEQGVAESAKVSQNGEGSVTIEGRKLACQIFKVVVPGEKKTRTTQLYFNNKVFPYVLRRETAITDNEGQSPPVKTSEQVIALNMPFRILSEIGLTSHIRSERKGPKGTTVKLSIHSSRVPGGVVAYWAKELDSEGRMTRRTMLELTDYDLEPAVRVRRRGRRNRRSELEGEEERVSDRRRESQER